MAERSEWHRPHFESSGHFGVLARGGYGSIFPPRRGPILQSARYITSLQTTTDPSTLTAVIQAGVITNGFLSGVLESVKDSDNNFFRNLFLDSNDILCYQQPENVRAHVSVPGTSREIGVLGAATLHDLQGTTVEAQQLASHVYSTRTPHSTPGKQKSLSTAALKWFLKLSPSVPSQQQRLQIHTTTRFVLVLAAILIVLQAMLICTIQDTYRVPSMM